MTASIVRIACADSAADAVPFASDELAQIIDERTIAIDATVKDAIMGFAARFEPVPAEIASLSKLLTSDAKAIPLNSLSLFLSRSDVQVIAAKLITHDDPLVRCIANVVLARSGDSEAAKRLHLLIHDESLSSIDKRLIRTVSDSIGIQPAVDGPETISTTLTTWLPFPPKLKEADRAPEFSATTANGRLITSSQLKGKVIVLHFWATTCQRAIARMPATLKALAKHDGKALEVIFVSLDDDIIACRSAIARLKIPYDNVCDGRRWGGALAGEFGIRLLPFDIVIGPDGKVFSNSLDDINAALAQSPRP